MFVGREKELAALEKLYNCGELRTAVVYGRRRVGKTRLLARFSQRKRTLFFTAQQKSNALNLRQFSRLLYEFCGVDATTSSFSLWSEAFDFLARFAASSGEPLLFVFDEFPYAAEADPSLPSALQIAMDHKLKEANVMLVLCGSNEGFMESEVLGNKSPLFGRRNAQIKLEPFSYYDAARFLEGKTPDELVMYYATFGGTPYYLEQIDPTVSFEDNVSSLLFDASGVLFAEPELLLRQETREPALYSSVLDAIGFGATTPKRIADQAGMAEGSVGRYLKSLEGLGLIERRVPVGENPARSRKGLYRIKDPFFAYWYRFVSPHVPLIEMGLGAAAAKKAFTKDEAANYVGGQFEQICLQWAVRQAALGRLPFLPTIFGGWWGTDPALHEQVDIDVVVANRAEGSALFGECKWRNRFNEHEAISVLRHRASLLPGFEQRMFALFTKRPVSKGTRAKAQAAGDMLLVSADQMF